jgi:hypothetical protein
VRRRRNDAISDEPVLRFVLRHDAPGSWAVIDTHIPVSRENRIIYRVSEVRAKQIADHLNKVFNDSRRSEM